MERYVLERISLSPCGVSYRGPHRVRLRHDLVYDLLPATLSFHDGRSRRGPLGGCRIGSELAGEANGLLHAAGIGPICAGDIEGRPVVHAGADDRQAKSDVHRGIEGQHLNRY